MRKQAKSKTKQGFLKKDVFSSLVYASPLWLSPPMNVHISHIEMTIHIGISGKYHFSLYFPLLIFHPPCFHSNQTYLKAIRPKGELKEKEIG